MLSAGRTNIIPGPGTPIFDWTSAVPLAPHLDLDAASLSGGAIGSHAPVRPDDIVVTTHNGKEPRPYQTTAVWQLMLARSRGRDRGLIVLPTGLGKTFAFSLFVHNLAAEIRKSDSHRRLRTLAISHRLPIHEQNADELALATRGKTTFVDSKSKDFSGDTVVASVQTLINCIDDIPDDFDMIVLDEAHHYVYGNDWFRVLIKLGFFEANGSIRKNPGKFLSGWTATPYRADAASDPTKHLKAVYGDDGLLYSRTLDYGITGGYLLKPEGKSVRIIPDHRTWPQNKPAEDMDPGEVLRAMAPGEIESQAVKLIRDKMWTGERYRKTLIFADDIGQARRIAAQLVDAGVLAVSFCYMDADKHERLAQFRMGRFEIAANKDIATEGYDDPAIEDIVDISPTESPSRVIQRYGRALRPDPKHPNRTSVRIWDLAGNIKRHRINMEVEEYYLENGQLIDKEAPLLPAKKKAGNDAGISAGGAPSKPNNDGCVVTEIPYPQGYTRILQEIFPEEYLANVSIDDHAITDARYWQNFTRLLQGIFPEDHLDEIAWNLGAHADYILRLINGDILPQDTGEIRKLVDAINKFAKNPVNAETLMDAWARDMVDEEMKTRAIAHFDEWVVKIVRRPEISEEEAGEGKPIQVKLDPAGQSLDVADFVRYLEGGGEDYINGKLRGKLAPFLPQQSTMAYFAGRFHVNPYFDYMAIDDRGIIRGQTGNVPAYKMEGRKELVVDAGFFHGIRQQVQGRLGEITARQAELMELAGRYSQANVIPFDAGQREQSAKRQVFIPGDYIYDAKGRQASDALIAVIDPKKLSIQIDHVFEVTTNPEMIEDKAKQLARTRHRYKSGLVLRTPDGKWQKFQVSYAQSPGETVISPPKSESSEELDVRLLPYTRSLFEETARGIVLDSVIERSETAAPINGYEDIFPKGPNSGEHGKGADVRPRVESAFVNRKGEWQAMDAESVVLNMGPAARELADYLRWIKWRYYRGVVDALPITGDIYRYISEGTFWRERKIFHANRGHAALLKLGRDKGIPETARKRILELFYLAAREYFGWDKPVISAQDRLLDKAREVALRTYGGLLPTVSKHDGISCQSGGAPLNNWLKTGQVRSGAGLTRYAFFSQVRSLFKTQGIPDPEADRLIEEAVFEEKKWKRDPKTARGTLVFMARKIIAAKYGGEVPRDAMADFLEKSNLNPGSPIMVWVENGHYECTKRITPAMLYPQIIKLLAGLGYEESEIEEHVVKSVFEERGWKQCEDTLRDKLLNHARRQLAVKFGGWLPTVNSIDGLPVQHSVSTISKWLYGKRVEYSPNLTAGEFYRQVRILFAALDSDLQEVEHLIIGSIYEERGWKVSEAPNPANELLDLVRRNVARVFGGKLPDEIVIDGMPRHAQALTNWLNNGKSNYCGENNPSNFYHHVETLLLAFGVERAVIERHIQDAIFFERDWLTDLDSAEGRLRNYFRIAVAQRYGGKLPRRPKQAMRGVPPQTGKTLLTKWLNNKYSQADSSLSPEQFYAQLRALARGLKMDMAEVERLLGEAGG